MTIYDVLRHLVNSATWGSDDATNTAGRNEALAAVDLFEQVETAADTPASVTDAAVPPVAPDPEVEVAPAEPAPPADPAPAEVPAESPPADGSPASSEPPAPSGDDPNEQGAA